MAPKITPKDIKKIFGLNLADFFFFLFIKALACTSPELAQSLSSSPWGVK